MPRLRVLLTEGSSLSARQALYALGRRGHVLDICDPQPLWCLARYSRYVRACHCCPPFAADPAGYLDRLLDRLRSGRYDVLLPTHDQVFLLARFRDVAARWAGLAVPDFTSLERLQSKAGLLRVLDEVGLPHPPTVLARTRLDLEAACSEPCYIKLAYSTAGQGVWRVRTPEECRQVADRLDQAGAWAADTEVLVQQPAPGVLGVVQSVFQRGRLVGGHCYQARALGVGGSARARVSATHPGVLEHIAALGARLNWHGALMLDYLWDPATGRPAYIDANPRLGETLNATLSGVNLAQLLLDVALDRPVTGVRVSRAGVRTHSIAMTLLAQAAAGARRRQLLAELGRACLGLRLYADSQEELTRPVEDPLSLAPAAFLCLRLFLNPAAAGALIGRAVDNYALSEAAARAIRRLPAASSQEPGVRSQGSGVRS
jgi:predicted ATP-grasp superfamily ATP-dependent carboligase